MRIDEFITQLRKNNGIIIQVIDQEIKIRASNEQLTPAIIAEIKSRKEEILSFFSGIKEKSRLYAIPKAMDKPYYGLSSAQKRMYFLYQMDRDSIAYNMPQYLQVKGKLDMGRVREALKDLVKRHEILRSNYRLVDGEPAQIIQEYVPVEVDHVFANELAPRLQSFVRPFCLEQDLLFRVLVITVSETEHLLAVDMHHIISDGVSNGLLIRDFMCLYNRQALPDLRLQYKDYAEWQQSSQHRERLKGQMNYWLDVFDGLPAPLSLPLDFVRPSEKQYEGACVKRRLRGSALTGLKLLSEQEGATMYMTLLAAFSVLVGKLGNTEDLVVGTIAAGRDHADLEHIIGMFANTLALRCRPAGKKSFAAFLTEVKQLTLAGFENQAFQHEELIKSLNIVRDGSRSPIVDVMFAYEDASGNEISFPGLNITPYEHDITVAKFDLTLNAAYSGDSLELKFDYDTSIFSQNKIERFADYYIRIIDAVTNDKDIVIHQIAMLSPTEQHELLVAFNNTEASYAKNDTLIDLFEEQVALTPDNVAVAYENKSMTYRELNERANQIARHLQQSGLSQGALVGLLMNRSIDMIAGIIGILKTGAAYLPLNSAHPLAKHKEIINESRTAYLLSNYENTELYEPFVNVIAIDNAAVGKYDTHNLWVIKRAEDMAYVIYTSGSTGRPNGVKISHRSVINLINAQQKAFCIDEDDVILQFATISFDASVEQIWLALLNGAKLLTIPPEVIADSNRFNKYISHHKVTHLHATPSFLNSLMADLPESVKRVIAGGEDCKPGLVSKFCNKHTFINEYGPTETTVTSIQYILSNQVPALDRIPIGRPLDNTKAYILGRNMELMPRNCTGELYIGGDGLADGYLHNELLTKERFLRNPYKEGSLFYKTGDLAYWQDDGTIVFTGRNDDQVKIRGFRIEPGEIETRISGHPAVQMAVVQARPVNMDLSLVAYYVAKEEVNTDEFRDFLGALLPDYMIPSYFVRLDSIPLNHNGKADKKMLPDPAPAIESNYIAPADDIEEELVEIWSSILNLDKSIIGTNRNFFELGGHSLKVITLSQKISAIFDVEISLKEIFRSNTIREIASLIQNAKWIRTKIDSSLFEEIILE